jgi:hypothetical protein
LRSKEEFKDITKMDLQIIIIDTELSIVKKTTVENINNNLLSITKLGKRNNSTKSKELPEKNNLLEKLSELKLKKLNKKRSKPPKTESKKSLKLNSELKKRREKLLGKRHKQNKE